MFRCLKYCLFNERKCLYCTCVGCISEFSLPLEAHPPWQMSLLWDSVESFRCIYTFFHLSLVGFKSFLFHCFCETFAKTQWIIFKVKGVKKDVPPLSRRLQQSSYPLTLSVSDVQRFLVCSHVLQDAPDGKKQRLVKRYSGNLYTWDNLKALGVFSPINVPALTTMVSKHVQFSK